MEKILILKNDIAEIGKLACFIEEFAAEASISQELVFNLNLALEEALANVIMYAYPKGVTGVISLQGIYNEEIVEFKLTDEGKEFDPTAAPDADVTLSAQDREIGGLGIFLIRQIMDSVEYERISQKNILTLKKRV